RESIRASNLPRNRRVRKAYTAPSARALLDVMLRMSPDVLAQENFIGVGVGVEVLALHGELLAVFQHLRVHEPLTGGGSSYRKSVLPDPDLAAATAKLLGALEYTGVAMLEFKKNLETGAW